MFVRILLDTCTICNYLHAVGKQLDLGAIRTSTEHLRFSLPGGAGVELLEQLTKGRVSWQEWTSGIPAIDSLLDQRWPLLPTGRLLAAIAGTQTYPAVNIEAERRRLRAVWRLLRHSKSTADLQRIGWYEAADGKRCATKIKLPKLQAAGSAERESWKKYIRRVQTLLAPFGIKQATEADILALMKMNQGTCPGDPPDLGDKLDSVARMIACLVAQALKTSDSYNPDSEKRRGDAFDISLLFYVPLPSVICTADEKFVNRLRDTGAPHARQVVSVEEFNEIVKRRGVETLVGDFRTPEDQHRRWREAAYFNWINRGCPFNDDQRDWFETEPVA
jgi:Protein of unknown function (DUF2934)